jgi:hypothetical protein
MDCCETCREMERAERHIDNLEERISDLESELSGYGEGSRASDWSSERSTGTDSPTAPYGIHELLDEFSHLRDRYLDECAAYDGACFWANDRVREIEKDIVSVCLALKAAQEELSAVHRLCYDAIGLPDADPYVKATGAVSAVAEALSRERTFRAAEKAARKEGEANQRRLRGEIKRITTVCEWCGHSYESEYEPGLYCSVKGGAPERVRPHDTCRYKPSLFSACAVNNEP